MQLIFTDKLFFTTKEHIQKIRQAASR